MGLKRGLAALGARRPRCYVVESPGGAAQRIAVERELEAREWRTVSTPASADALIVAGALPPELTEAAELLWSQVPGPRARCVVEDALGVSDALDELQRDLADDDGQQREARERERDQAAPWLAEEDADDHGDMDHGDMDHGDMDHGDMDHGDMDHGDMDHGDMDMAPAGIPLAEGGEDRDGLEMDVLVHPLGPLLDRWPGGLELRVSLQGDVVAEAEARVQGAGHRGVDRAPVAAWDAVATTLSLAGDERGARAARRVRDSVVDGRDVEATEADRLRVRLERLARWSVLPSRAVETLIELTSRDIGVSARTVVVSELVQGCDLADVRLLVASHAPLLVVSDDQQEGTGRG